MLYSVALYALCGPRVGSCVPCRIVSPQHGPKNLYKIGQIASDRRETLWKRRAGREESKNPGPEAQKPQFFKN